MPATAVTSKSRDTAANYYMASISHWIEECMHTAQVTEDISGGCHLGSFTTFGVMKRSGALRIKHSPGVH